MYFWSSGEGLHQAQMRRHLLIPLLELVGHTEIIWWVELAQLLLPRMPALDGDPRSMTGRCSVTLVVAGWLQLDDLKTFLVSSHKSSQIKINFVVAPAAWICFKEAINLASCSCLVAPKISTSSIWHKTPSNPPRIVLILLWNSSGTLEIPWGNLLKQNHPKGVMEVVSKQDSSFSGICQKPLLASNLLNTVAP